MTVERNRRWAAIAADMRDHPLVGMEVPPPKPADHTRHAQSPFVAWTDIIMSAAYADHTTRFAGRPIALRRGEFPAGRSHWAKRWNWGEQSVRGFFARLAAEEMIAFCNRPDNQVVSVAKICNYDTFQHADSGPQPARQPRANQAPTKPQPHTTREYKDTKETGAIQGATRALRQNQKDLLERSIIDTALADFNRAAELIGFTRCLTLSEARGKALTKRLRDLGRGDLEAGAQRFREALGAIPHWPFLAGRERGRNGRAPFRLDLERLLSTTSGLGDVLAKLCDLHDEHGPARVSDSGTEAGSRMDAWDDAQAEELTAQRARLAFDPAADGGGPDAVH